MRIIHAVPGRLLEIGKTSTAGTTAVRFDVADWQEEYPEGIIYVINRRYGDTEPYPVENVTVGDGYVDWGVTVADTEQEGYGEVELVLMDGDTEAKTETWQTHVSESVCPVGTTTPTAAQGWVDQVLAAATTATTAATNAATSAGNAATSETNAATSAGNAATSETNAANSASAARSAASSASGSAGRASSSASSASTSAGRAATSETNAGNSATAAAGSATAAAGSATSASASALKAEGYAVGKQNGTDVGSDSTYYHNNAKYYAEGAQTAYDGVTAEGTRQIGLVTAEGTTQVGLVEDKGDEVLASIPADYTTLSNTVASQSEEIATLNTEITLQMKEIPDTVQTITYDSNGNVTGVVHSRDGNAVRTDTYTFGTDTVTEVRTLSTGASLTIVTNTTTLVTTVTYTAA